MYALTSYSVGIIEKKFSLQLTDDEIEIAGLRLDPVSHRTTGNDINLSLGPTEFRLLRHFMENPTRVFSRGQLLDAVWGNDSDIELRTVDVHIRRLRKAINLPGMDDPIRTVRSAGYALDGG